MYIHRVGRTARYTAGGRGLLMLMPSEEKPVIESLSQAGIPIKKLSMNPNKTVSVSSRAAALLVSNPECRSLAKKAFTSYLKSYLLLPRNKVSSFQFTLSHKFLGCWIKRFGYRCLFSISWTCNCSTSTCRS